MESSFLTDFMFKKTLLPSQWLNNFNRVMACITKRSG